jgi:hypothetical protein
MNENKLVPDICKMFFTKARKMNSLMQSVRL